jgi:hypothetical protein
MLKAKLLEHLKRVGASGASRTELLQRFRCSREELDKILEPLVGQGEIRTWIDTKSLGRPATRYYDKLITLDLTAPIVESKIPFKEVDEPTKRSTLCRVCGVAIPIPDTGHPFYYCSERCKRSAHANGSTLQEFLFRAGDPRVFAEAAILLVMADLVIRGFRVGRGLFQTGSRILVTDDQDAVCFLDVIPISLDGTFPNPDEYASMAAVYRDGRIVYGGKHPIVVEKDVPDES